MQRNFIRETVPAGEVDLKSYESELIRSGRAHPQLAAAGAGPSVAVDSDGDEVLIQFRLNVTGNVWYATTSPMHDLSEDHQNLFEGVMVMFAAMTRALAEERRNLLDFQDWSNLLHRSGFFIPAGSAYKEIKIKSDTAPVDGQILSQLLPGIEKSQMAVAIGKEVLGAVSGEYVSRRGQGDVKVGHLLFVCEEILGAASVSVRLFHADNSQLETALRSPCHKTAKMPYTYGQNIDFFLFQSPEQISQYATSFREHSDQYRDLVEKLKTTLRR